MEMERDRKLILEALETLLQLQLRSVRQLLNRAEETPVGPQPRRRRRKSLVDLVVDLLTSEGRPLHVDTLLELLQQRYGRVTERDALSSALSKQAGPEGALCRVAPATFARRQQR